MRTNDLDEDTDSDYGIDWEALEDSEMLQSHRSNNPEENNFEDTNSRTRDGSDRWMNEVRVDPPTTPISLEVMQDLDAYIQPFRVGLPEVTVASVWTNSLIFLRSMHVAF